MKKTSKEKKDNKFKFISNITYYDGSLNMNSFDIECSYNFGLLNNYKAQSKWDLNSNLTSSISESTWKEEKNYTTRYYNNGILVKYDRDTINIKTNKSKQRAHVDYYYDKDNNLIGFDYSILYSNGRKSFTRYRCENELHDKLIVERDGTYSRTIKQLSEDGTIKKHITNYDMCGKIVEEKDI